ncbi:PKD domain-containing protein [Methanosarcina sp. WWM596]|uniref:PKD domain-containing protein n=1 Tax=Methanosarcina sp. WWM596 TaxID=1434103 RepID=UPI00061554EC|nr:PKD domain-containing protein [Methanosarcina sp. WWM596]AKB18679.1 cell surface protein [Methanosarcina sp. WWM596]
MNDIKQDVKESVKVFTLTFVSYVVKESTKKLIKSLTQIQRKMLEVRVKNLSDDQLEQYFDKESYFKNELENTLKSVNHIQPAKGSESWLENLQLTCETSCIQNLIYFLIQPVTKIALATVAVIALVTMFAVPLAISGESEEPDLDTKFPVANFSNNVTSGYAPLSVQFLDLSGNTTEWNWDFGDRTNSTEQNPVHNYPAAGIYTVSLTAANTYGTDSAFARITVLEKSFNSPVEPLLPFAKFTSSTTKGYSPLSVKFTDLSENATGWNWDFGDGTNSIEQNPAHIYSFAGNYTVNLTAVNTNGTDSAFAVITVLKRSEPVQEPALPVASFSTNVTRGYSPLSVQFTDLSEHATEWNWDFGDGATSTGQNSVHTYSAAGNYTASLTVNNANGTDSKRSTILVFPVYAYVTKGDGTVSLIDTATREITGNISVGINPYEIAVTQDGTVYVANSGDGSENSSSISIIDTATKTVIDTLSAGGNGTFVGVAVNPAGTKVYVTNSGDGTISIIDTITRKIIDTVNVGDTPERIVFTPDGTKLYVVNSGSNNISVIDTATNNITATLETDDPWGVAIMPDGTKVYVTNDESNRVFVIDTITDNVTTTVNLWTSSRGVAVTPDGTKVYVTNYNDGIISVIDTSNNIVTNIVYTVSEISSPSDVKVTPDGKEIYVTNSGVDSVSIIDTETDNIITTISVGKSPVGVAIIQR